MINTSDTTGFFDKVSTCIEGELSKTNNYFIDNIIILNNDNTED